MAITKHLFGICIQGAPLNFNRWTENDIKVGLFTSAWTPDFDNTLYYDQVSAYECEDEGFSGGYMAGGRSLQNKTTTNDPAQPFVVAANNVIWEMLTATFRYLLFWDYTASNFMIGGIDYGSDQVYTAQEFTLEMPDGFFSISA